jgi:hypothetical protein
MYTFNNIRIKDCKQTFTTKKEMNWFINDHNVEVIKIDKKTLYYKIIIDLNTWTGRPFVVIDEGMNVHNKTIKVLCSIEDSFIAKLEGFDGIYKQISGVDLFININIDSSSLFIQNIIKELKQKDFMLSKINASSVLYLNSFLK